MTRICIFAGASRGNSAKYTTVAKAVGAMMAARGIGLVYGGGRTGLMGAVADGALAEGGFVHGVIPQFLATLEVAHQGVSELTVTETMQERKSIMYAASDAFIALPGGYGTMEELLETITQRQLKIHNKPIAIFNVKGEGSFGGVEDFNVGGSVGGSFGEGSVGGADNAGESGYWDRLIEAFHGAAEAGFIRQQHLGLFEVVESVDEMGDFLDKFVGG